MKTLTLHPGVLRYGISLVIFGMVLIFAFPERIPPVFQAHIILLLSVGILLLTPWANQLIPLEKDTAKRKPFPQAFGLTLAVEGTLLLLFYTATHLVSVTLPEQGSFSSTLLSDSLTTLSYTWGLFPWGSYVLLAAAIAYACYIKRQAGDMGTVLRPLLKSRPADISSLFVDVLTKLTILFTLGSTFAFLIYEVVGLIAKQLGLHLMYGPRLDLLIVVMLLINTCRGKFAERPLRWLSRHHIPPGILVIAFLILAVVTILAISTLLSWITPLFAPTFTTTLPLQTEGLATLWHIFMGMWWLGWAPLTAGLLAYTWRGYRIRTLLVMPLLLPLALAGSLAVAPHWHWSMSNNTSLLNLLPALLGLTGVLLLFLRLRYVTYVWKAKLSFADLDYRGNAASFLTRLVQAIVLLGGCFWVGGIQMTTMLFFFINYMTIIFIFAAAIALYKVLLFKDIR